MKELATMYYYGKKDWLKMRHPVHISDNSQLGLFHMRKEKMIFDCTNNTEGKDYDKSIDLLKNALKLDPKDGVVNFYLGQLYEYGCGTKIDYKTANSNSRDRSYVSYQVLGKFELMLIEVDDEKK